MMTISQARGLAKRVHRGQTDRDGSPHFDHCLRVAELVPEECKRVALLHDTVEDTDITLDDLRAFGLPEDEVQAVDLMSRPTIEQAQARGIVRPTYIQFVTRVATADGEPGRLARRVKEADMLENLQRSLRSNDPSVLSLANRYRKHLPIILDANL